MWSVLSCRRFPPKKELPMQHNAADIRRLIAVAQNTSCAEDREDALKVLWDMCGAPLVGSMAKKSYMVDSDFGYRGYSPAERRRNMMGDAYVVFYDCVMSFDTKMGVPFAAYAAQKGNWRVADEKRENSRRSKVEVVTDLPPESETAYKPEFVNDIYDTDTVRAIRMTLEQDAKLCRYFNTCMELCDADLDYSDAEVARRMGCTRANVGLYRKAFVKKVKNCRLFA